MAYRQTSKHLIVYVCIHLIFNEWNEDYVHRRKATARERETESLFQAVASLILFHYWQSFEFQTLLSLDQVIEGEDRFYNSGYDLSVTRYVSKSVSNTAIEQVCTTLTLSVPLFLHRNRTRCERKRKPMTCLICIGIDAWDYNRRRWAYRVNKPRISIDVVIFTVVVVVVVVVR